MNIPFNFSRPDGNGNGQPRDPYEPSPTQDVPTPPSKPLTYVNPKTGEEFVIRYDRTYFDPQTRMTYCVYKTVRPLYPRPTVSGTPQDFEKEQAMLLGVQPGQTQAVVDIAKRLGLTVHYSSPLGYLYCSWKQGTNIGSVLSAIRAEGKTIRYCEPNYSLDPAVDAKNEAKDDSAARLKIKEKTDETAVDVPVTEKDDSVSDASSESRIPNSYLSQPIDEEMPLWGLEAIGAPTAWSAANGQNVIVAVVDSGVDYLHPDLASNIYVHTGTLPIGYPAKSETRKNVYGVNLCADGKQPFSEVDQSMSFDPHPLVLETGELDAHGTHVAGTIAGTDRNGNGIMGVAPRCKILPIQAAYVGMDINGNSVPRFSIASLSNAIYYACSNGAKVINISAGFSQDRKTFENLLWNGPIKDALEYSKQKSVLLVVAAGNEGQNDTDRPNIFASFARYYPNILGVASIDEEGNLATSSNWGTQSVEMAAPGEKIRSTVPKGKYGVLSGTSMASPHVAGAAALLLSRAPHLTPEQVKSELIRHSRPNSELLGRVFVASTLDVGFLESWECPFNLLPVCPRCGQIH